MKLRDRIKIKRVETPPPFTAVRYAELVMHRSEPAHFKQSDADLIKELCRDIMNELGLTDKEMIELERRQ